jgi:UDP-N-acetylmuramate: L-alanyl-gamma-D-glutamyl-meso-diaminopimelate ligase
VVRLVPPEGTVVVNADDPRVMGLLPEAVARVVRVSVDGAEADFSATGIEMHPTGTDLTLSEAGRPAARLRSPLLGLHNVRNLLGAVALARGLGLSVSEIARSLQRFEGGRRRLEVKGEKKGILLVDDFAHHPTAVCGTIEAARSRWPGRRLWVLFEPRSNTAGRKIFEEDYAQAFSGADVLVIAPVFHSKRLAPEERIDREALVRRFASKGKPAFAPESVQEIPDFVKREARSGDVLLLMSSGAFGGLPETLLERL